MSKRNFSFHVVVGIFLWAILLCANFARSQAIPSFRMQLTNGKMFSNKDLENNKAVLLIYYAPDCEHCQLLLKEIFKKFDNFKKVQIILVTFEPLQYASAFEQSYGIRKYNNIKTGVEIPTFFFKNYYNLMNTPFTALFNKKGNMVVSYQKQTPVDDLIKHIKAL
jgi:peroxiredoxin